jgi:UDP-N-acetyl-D-mannosaminuronate dehydrogenase
MHPVLNVELAELSKVIENAHRYLQIAFAEDLYLYCEANQLDFRQLRAALNTKWNVQILEPREGIGGHCLPKDTRMFLESSQAVRSKILTAALEVDTQYRMYRETIFRNRLKGLDYNKKEELMHILRHSESSPTIQQPNIVASTLKATTEAS